MDIISGLLLVTTDLFRVNHLFKKYPPDPPPPWGKDDLKFGSVEKAGRGGAAGLLQWHWKLPRTVVPQSRTH